MSLLLDALKKAAADKHRNTQSLTDSSSSANLNTTVGSDENQLNNMSMDLELHPDALNTNNDDYPTVNPSVKSTKKNKRHNSKSSISKKQLKKEKNKHIQKIESEIIEPSIPSEKKELVDKYDSIINKHNITSEQIAKNSFLEKEKQDLPEVTQTVIPSSHPQPIENLTSDSKLTDEALTELINKSNKHTKYETTKKWLLAGIISLLILFASVFYFYNQLKISNDNIYITDTLSPKPDILSIAHIEASTPEKSATNDIIRTDINQKKSPIHKIIKNKQKIIIESSPKTSIKKPIKYTRKEITNKKINFIKTKKTNPINKLLRDAYHNFKQNKYTDANILYTNVLNLDNKNRDALLGLAAIGLKNNRYEFSRQKYLYLLKLNPRDSLAIAGLSSLNNQENSQLSESKLKFLLKQQPDAGHLYFALGTLYSSKKKWAEAQSAYFSAWSSNNKNADYAYNLAVSLDHLDKSSQALNFYTLSLKLHTTSNGNFSIPETKKRVLTLRSNKK